LSVTIVINLDTIKKIVLSSKKEKEDIMRKSQDEKSSLVSVAEETSTSQEVLSVIVFDARSRNEWVLDSGCSYHICPRRDWFLSYQPIDGGNVLMGNNMPCKKIGIGSIKIRMHDDIVRTLNNVRHMPDLKKKLISLGTLDSNGYKFSAEGGVLRVSKGSLIVMKGKKVNTLYILQGSAMISVAAVSMSEGPDLHTTRLWHMQLGYMSERGLHVLSK